MKNGLIYAIVIASSALATAQVLPPDRSVSVPALSLCITAPDQPRHISEEEFKSYAGEYALANGQILRLRRASGGAMYARIGNQEEHRIVGAGKNVFVALNRKLKLRIEHRRDGSVKGELVMVVPGRVLPDGSIGGEEVAALQFPQR